MPQIIGNITGAVKLDFEWDLARFTAFVGPNGTGKTAVQEAIDLAVNHKRFERAALEPIFPLGYSHASAQLDILGARYAFDSRLETQASPAPIMGGTPSGPIPRPVIVRPASWLVALGKQRAREEVLARWGGDQVISLYPPHTLSPMQKDLWQKGLDSVRAEIKAQNEKKAKQGKDLVPSDAASLLAELQNWARREKLAYGRQRDALAETIAGLQTSLPSTAGAEDLGRLEAALAAAETSERTAIVFAEQSSRIDARIVKLNADIAAWQVRLAQLQSVALPDRVPVAAEVESIRTFIANQREDFPHEAIARAINMVSTDRCPCCGGAYQREQAFHYHTGQGQTISIAKQNLREKEGQLSFIDRQIAQWNGERDAIATEQSRIQSEASFIERDRSALPAAYNGPSSEVLRPQVFAARAASATRAAIEQQAKQLEEQNALWTIAQTVEKTAGIELKIYIEKISTTIDTAVRGHLAPMHRNMFYFDFEACRFEMRGSDGRTHERYEQSGGEYAALTLAIARAWAGGKPYIMLLEYGRDLAELDSFGALAQVLDALAKIDDPYCVAIVIAAPQPLPVGDEWLVHQTQHRPRTAHVTESAMPVPVLSEQVVPVSALSVVNPPTNGHSNGTGFFKGDARGGDEPDETNDDEESTVSAPASRAALDAMTQQVRVADGPIGAAPPTTKKGRKKAAAKKSNLRAKPSARKSR